MIQTFTEIEERRISLGVPAHALARAAGIAPSTYGRLQKEQSSPMADTLEKLSNALLKFEKR